MAIGLSISDNGNNTGGVATVTGTAGGATNTLYYAAFDGTPSQRVFLAAGSRTGDGTIAISTQAGHYVFILTTSGQAGLGQTVYETLTAATVAQYDQILSSVVTRILSLSIAELPSGKVRRMWIARHEREANLAPPLCMVSPLGNEKEVGKLIGTDTIAYPVLIATLVKQDSNNVANMPRWLLIRELIAKAFSNQRLPGVPASQNVTIDYEAVAEMEAFKANALLGGFILWVECRRARGIS